MKNKDDIKVLLDYFQNTNDKPLILDEDAIVSAYQKDNTDQSLAIKILSMFGGFLAILAFLGFLYLAKLYNSDIGLLLSGGILIACSIWINKQYNKIIMDTISVSAFILGFILIAIGGHIEENGNILSIIFIIIALGSLSIVQNYILCFVSVLIINQSILMLIISNSVNDVVHIYVAILALAMAYIFLKEAKIITTNKALSKLYNPVKTGLVFSFLSGLFILSGKEGNFPVSPEYMWLSSIVIIPVIVYLTSTLFSVLNITEKRHKICVYIFTALALSPTALSPAISGAILIILLSFMINYKTGFVLGITSFIYFVSQYYYDLNLTLLTKSILLFSTGVLFIALYLITYKKLTENEKV
ncbi:MAG: DUF4401 domain-containing protein [Ignavibacteria bacterium]|jgi:uncharacterized membrane protein|nr:DUF4401 domain-containing protein [Ignavibacteria bacterium]